MSATENRKGNAGYARDPIISGGCGNGVSYQRSTLTGEKQPYLKK